MISLRTCLALLLLLSAGAALRANAWDAPHAANPILPGYYADPVEEY